MTYSIPLSGPDITDRERQAVLEVLNTQHLSLGPKLALFEEKMAAIAGTKFAVAVNSGTSALHLIVRAMGIGEGDEVITTPFSFIASSNCILFERARPVFVDIDPLTLNLDPGLIEEAVTPRTKAILGVDVFGHPADWDAIGDIAKRRSVKVIEDSCEAIGAFYKGRPAGSFGQAGAFAFYPNKQMTTGEGGVIVTDDEEIASLCRSMRNQGRGESDEWLQHTRLGFNYRLSDIQCALGIVQAERLEELLAKRERVARWYSERLGDIEEIEVPFVHPSVSRMSWLVYVIRLSEHFSGEDRDLILSQLRGKGISCSNYFTPIHLQPFYAGMFNYKTGDFPIAESVSKRTIALPFFSNLSEEQVDLVVSNLRAVLGKLLSTRNLVQS